MKQLNDVLDSYVNKNFDKAKEVWEKDEQVDDLTYIAMESVIDFLSLRFFYTFNFCYKKFGKSRRSYNEYR